MTIFTKSETIRMWKKLPAKKAMPQARTAEARKGTVSFKNISSL